MLSNSVKQKAYLDMILASCPDILIHSARLHMHDGELHDILIVNEELVFRFPRHEKNIPEFLREIRLLKKLQDLLPLPVPSPIYDSGAMTGLGKVFMGYRLIPGQPLDEEILAGIENETVLPMLAKQLADFLTAMHRLTPDGLSLDLPRLNMPDWTHTFFDEIQKKLFFYMRPDACKTVTENFEHYFSQADLHSYQPSLVHGDFGGSNILFDNNGISGVLDFTGACYSDPALDIASVSTYGDGFYECICRFYPVSDSMAKRAKFYRSLFALEEALYGWKNDDEEAFGRGMEQFI